MIASPDLLHRPSHALILAMDEVSETIRVPFEDGHTVWRRWGAGPPLVLLHGGGGCWMHWLRNIEALAGTYTVWAPDLPCFGDSDAPGGVSGALRPGERNDVIESGSGGPPPPPMAVVARIVAEALPAVVGDAPVILVGFSFGSAVAAHVSARLGRGRVRMLVFCGGVGLTEPAFGRMLALSSWQGVTEAEKFRAIHRDNLAKLMIFDPKKIDDLAVDIQILGTSRARMRRARRRSDILAALGPTGIKVSGIWGEKDVTAAAPFETFLGRLQGLDPAAELKVIPETGHWVAYESADAFNATLLTLLARAA